MAVSFTIIYTRLLQKACEFSKRLSSNYEDIHYNRTLLWFVRTENVLVIFQSLYEAGRWPVGIYRGWLQFALTSLVPIAFAVTVPSEALTTRLNGQTPLLAVGLAVGLLLLSRWFYSLRLGTPACRFSPAKSRARGRF